MWANLWVWRCMFLKLLLMYSITYVTEHLSFFFFSGDSQLEHEDVYIINSKSFTTILVLERENSFRYFLWTDYFFTSSLFNYKILTSFLFLNSFFLFLFNFYQFLDFNFFSHFWNLRLMVLFWQLFSWFLLLTIPFFIEIG